MSEKVKPKSDDGQGELHAGVGRMLKEASAKPKRAIRWKFSCFTKGCHYTQVGVIPPLRCPVCGNRTIGNDGEASE